MRHRRAAGCRCLNRLPEDIRLAFEDRADYLYAEVSGPRDSNDISLAYWARIADECRSRGARRLMVFERLGDYEGERDLPALVDAVIAMGMDSYRIAFVVSRIELLATMEHGEILAMERGVAGRVFGNAATAESWLRHGA